MDGMKTRLDMLDLLGAEIPNARVAEVGVLRGIFANQIYNRMKPSLLLLVDPWTVLKNYRTASPNSHQEEWDARYAAVVKKFQDRPEAKLVRMMSLNAAVYVDDGSLDFVYIDANHAYEYVKEDILAWRPKVRPGGYIGGHDYDMDSVRRAVDETLGKVMSTTDDRAASFLLKV